MSLDDLTKRRIKKLAQNLSEELATTVEDTAAHWINYTYARERLMDLIRAQWSGLAEAMTNVDEETAEDLFSVEGREDLIDALGATNGRIVQIFIESITDELITEASEGLRAYYGVHERCLHTHEARSDAALDPKSRDKGPIKRMDCARRQLFVYASGQSLDNIIHCLSCEKPLLFRTWRPADAVDLGDEGPWTYCRTCDRWGTLFGNSPVEPVP